MSVKYQYYSSVTEKEVDWLWYPYIPYGKITLLQGDPGEGKSTFILNVVSLLTKGETMPDGYKSQGIQSVIYQCSEDGAADTVKPRLMAAGADCKKVAYIVEEEESLTLDDKRIEEAIVETGARLVILDPLQSFLPQEGDMHSAGRMRNLLGGLSNVAEKYNCAIVIIGHMNKSQSGKYLYRGLGSIDITAIARSVLMVERDEDNPSIRYMFPVKSSLAAEGDAIAFKFDRKHGFQWLGACDYKSYEEPMEAVETKADIAERLLFTLLSEKEMPGSQVLQFLAEAGISERTVNTVKKKLGIVSYRQNNRWFWKLPKQMQDGKEAEYGED